jgi:hypothetical protein
MKNRILAMIVVLFFFPSNAGATLGDSPRKSFNVSQFGQPFGSPDAGGPLGSYRLGDPLGPETFGNFWDQRFGRDLGPSFFGQQFHPSGFTNPVPALLRSFESAASRVLPRGSYYPASPNPVFYHSGSQASDFLSVWEDLSQLSRSFGEWCRTTFVDLLQYQGPF